MNQAFSKIWIVIILAVFVAGGILAWQYWWMGEKEAKMPKVKAPEEIAKEFIQVNQPKPNQKIISPIEIKGEVKAFEYKILDDLIRVEIFDESGHKLSVTNFTLPENGHSFSVKVSYQQPTSEKGTVEIFVFVPTEGFIPSEGVLESWSRKTLAQIPIIFGEEPLVIPADWNAYNNPSVNFTFKYPKDWEIKRDYEYKTPACEEEPGCRGKQIVELGKVGGTKVLIAINMPQLTGIKWSDLPGGNWICAFDEDSEVLDIYEYIKGSFRVIQDKTADWKIYRNEKYGFEFKHPASFDISVFQPENPNSVLGLKITESEKHIGFVFVSRFTQDTNKEMQDFKNYLIKLKEDNPATKVKIKEFYIGNYPVLQISFVNITVSDVTGEVNESPISALETFNDKYSYNMDCLPANAPCDQILPTFKFIK